MNQRKKQPAAVPTAAENITSSDLLLSVLAVGHAKAQTNVDPSVTMLELIKTDVYTQGGSSHAA